MIDELKNITDKDGSLTPIEFKDLSFIPKRIFYVTNVPINELRGQHAHFETQQLLICIKGVIGVKLHDGNALKQYVIKEGESIFVDKMIWDSQSFLTGNDILLVICNTEYDRKDYIEDFEEFKKLKNQISNS